MALGHCSQLSKLLVRSEVEARGTEVLAHITRRHAQVNLITLKFMLAVCGNARKLSQSKLRRTCAEPERAAVRDAVNVKPT